MAVVNKFNVNKKQVTLDADIIENMSANDVSYDDSTQYNENTVGNKLSELGQQVIYDVTANNNGATFASLSALLSSENLSTLIPVAVRCGGMSIRFVQSSDNKYVQYRHMSDSWSSVERDWQKQGTDVVVTQNIQTTIQEGTKVDVGNNSYSIGDYLIQSRLDSCLCNIVSIEHNTIETSNGKNTEPYPLIARTSHYIVAPFNIVLNSGFVFNSLLKYSRDINGKYTFIEARRQFSSVSLSINDNYIYRITFRKEDNTEITDDDLLNIVSSFDGVLNVNQNDIKKNVTFYNVNYVLGTYTTYYTLETAINAIPSADRKPLMTIAYRIEGNSYAFAQYLRSFLTDDYFINTNSWKVIITTDESQHSGFTNVNVYNKNINGYSTLIDAVSTIVKADRKIGHIITFRDAVDMTIWHTYQYKYSDVTDNYWLNANSWIFKGECTELEFTEIGGIDKSTGKNYQFGSYCCTPYLRITVGMTVSGYEDTNIAMLAFYDNQFNYISSYPLTVGKEHIITITAQDIPSGAVYLRASGNSKTKGFITGYKGTTIDVLAVDLWKSQELQDFVLFLKRGVMYPLGNASIGDVIYLSNNSSTECIAIPCNEGDRFIITGIGGANPRLWGWCDVDMKLLSCSESNITRNKLSLIAPSDAKYFIFNNIFLHKTAKIVKDNRNYDVSIASSKWLALGDSITQGYYSRIPPTSDDYPYALDPTKGWAYLTSQITGKTLINQAIGGTGVSFNHGTVGNSGRELIDTLISNGTLDSSIDLITIAYGVNDWKYNCVLGTWEDEVTSTNEHIIPSMRYVIERCCAAAPNAKIILIMPINCKFGNEADNWGIGYSFSNNGSLELIYEKFKQICEYYGIEYIDMLHSSIVNRKNIGDVLLDNVHPSIPTHIAMARELSQKINCY